MKEEYRNVLIIRRIRQKTDLFVFGYSSLPEEIMRLVINCINQLSYILEIKPCLKFNNPTGKTPCCPTKLLIWCAVVIGNSCAVR